MGPGSNHGEPSYVDVAMLGCIVLTATVLQLKPKFNATKPYGVLSAALFSLYKLNLALPVTRAAPSS